MQKVCIYEIWFCSKVLFFKRTNPQMKELLKQYASYNVWANQRISEVILSLPEDKYEAEVISSFPGLYKTALHIWDAESGWWQRIKMQERVFFPRDAFSGSMKDLFAGLLSQSKQWESWVQHASDLSLRHVFHFQNSKKELFRQPAFQVLLHVFNHSTYHRGQLVTILRQLGVEKLPPIDFIVWIRQQQ
jgi:uncharacterized damage-inducible protein DinB